MLDVRIGHGALSAYTTPVSTLAQCPCGAGLPASNHRPPRHSHSKQCPHSSKSPSVATSSSHAPSDAKILLLFGLGWRALSLPYRDQACQDSNARTVLNSTPDAYAQYSISPFDRQYHLSSVPRCFCRSLESHFYISRLRSLLTFLD